LELVLPLSFGCCLSELVLVIECETCVSAFGLRALWSGLVSAESDTVYLVRAMQPLWPLLPDEHMDAGSLSVHPFPSSEVFCTTESLLPG